MELVTIGKIVKRAREERDVVLQADALAGFDEVLAADLAEVRVMKNEIAKFRALLDEVHLGKTFHLVVEAVKADQFTENDSRVVEAERLVKIAGQEKLFGHVLVPCSYLSWWACSGKPPHPLLIHLNRVSPTRPHELF